MNGQYAVVAVLVVVLATVLISVGGLRFTTTPDFFVASRAVPPWLNASAICGEYLSAASFIGVAGLIFANGVDMLWFAVGYTAGYLVMLTMIAAPLRRSGAFTVPDFAEARLESRVVRRIAGLLTVGIACLYLLPQMQGAGLILRAATGAPQWVGEVVVAAVVLGNVMAGGMRSVTFVQAFQFWLKLAAIAIPAIFLVLAWRAVHSPPVMPQMDVEEWSQPLMDTGLGYHPLYIVYSIIVATFLGVMGLPHVIVRFYTNVDGAAARRTTVRVLGLLGIFYLLPPVYGVLGRMFAPDLLASGDADAVVLILPERLVGGLGGALLGALIVGGAFAAFLSTSSGLAVSVAGVISQDLLRRHGIRGFRLAAVVAVVFTLGVALLAPQRSVAGVVGLAFAVAASSLCPLVVLGIWWPRLTRAGAAAGMVTGGGLALGAGGLALAGVGGGGWWHDLFNWPALWTVPAGFGVMVVVSLARPGRVSAGALRTMILLHAPESLGLDRQRDASDRVVTP